jgi:pimeloyl-ACP methyl ester carboxylesterase
LTIKERAAHCAAVLEAVGTGPAWVCGHSSGAIIALQLALDRPDLVGGVAVLEPAPVGELASPTAIEVAQGPMAASMAAYGEGDAAKGFDRFMRATCAPDYAEVLERVLGPGAVERGIEESRAFPLEAAACAAWEFGASEAELLTMPVLAVAGTATSADCPLPPDSVNRLAGLVSHAEVAWLSGVNHMMTMTDPGAVGGLLAAFAQRHAPHASTPVEG